MSSPDFANRRVLSLESRRAKEIESLITTFGGRPVVAPAVRELPLDSDADVLALGDGIIAGAFDVVAFLTGVGARALVEAMDRAGRRDALIAALREARIVVRGPKPLAVMRELDVPVWATAPEPNTWRELLVALDTKAGAGRLTDARVAVQEYGVSNSDLLDALRARGARVTAAPTYQWAMPEDLEPLREGVRAVVRGDIDVIVITSGIQIVNFLAVAREMGLEADVKQALSHTLVASIGPSSSAELRRHDIEPTFEPSRPKMGLLIREAAERVGTTRSEG